jgi:hypothetical protein
LAFVAFVFYRREVRSAPDLGQSRLQDIASVAPLNEKVDFGESQRGSVIAFRAVPGLTTKWLQRTIDCHLARNAAMVQ